MNTCGVACQEALEGPIVCCCSLPDGRSFSVWNSRQQLIGLPFSLPTNVDFTEERSFTRSWKARWQVIGRQLERLTNVHFQIGRVLPVDGMQGDKWLVCRSTYQCSFPDGMSFTCWWNSRRQLIGCRSECLQMWISRREELHLLMECNWSAVLIAY